MINERYPLAGYLSAQNPWIAKPRRRWPKLLAGLVALAAVLYFVCDVVVTK